MKDRDSELEPDWSRSEWARWWLDHNEPAAAAAALEAGDVVVIEPADAQKLEVALARRSLVLLCDDGQGFVLPPHEARAALDNIERDEFVAAGPRRAIRSTVGRSDDASNPTPTSTATLPMVSRGRR